MRGLDLFIAGLVADPEDFVRIGGVGAHVAGADAGPVVLVEAKDRGHFRQVIELLLGDLAVGPGDVEEALDQLLQDRRVMAEQAADLLGIGLEPMGVAARLVEQAADVLHFLLGDVEDFLEGADLVLGDDTVGLGHLGAQHDDADGEGDAPGGIVLGRLAGAVAHLVDGMAGTGAENRADRPTDGEAGRAAQNFAPYAHGPDTLMAPIRS